MPGKKLERASTMSRQITPPGLHCIEQGDYLAKIAKWYGIPDWKTVWEHPENAELRSNRKNPNLLLPGEFIFIPESSLKEESAATEKKHRFKLKEKRIHFKLKLLDGENEARSSVPYKLTVTGESFSELKFEGQCGSDGKIEHELPADAETGTLKLAEKSIRLQFGHLDPLETATGQQARLANLGYYNGEIDGICGPLTMQAIKAFQMDYPPLAVDGICGPQTQDKLKEVHGC
jgi:hypothetical protein